jgi:hypothetical protein
MHTTTTNSRIVYFLDSVPGLALRLHRVKAAHRVRSIAPRYICLLCISQRGGCIPSPSYPAVDSHTDQLMYRQIVLGLHPTPSLSTDPACGEEAGHPKPHVQAAAGTIAAGDGASAGGHDDFGSGVEEGDTQGVAKRARYAGRAGHVSHPFTCN